MEAYQQHLRHYLEQTAPISDEAWEDFVALWELVEYKRKTVLTLPGTSEDYLYFVVKGVQRVHYYDDQDRQSTLVFTYPYSFAGVADAFLTRQPSRFCYETLTQSTLLRISHHQLKKVETAHPEIGQLLHQMAAHVLSDVLARMVELQCYSATEKFRVLLQRSPHLLQIVPHKYLASYIGIDATNFSKLMNSVQL